VKITRRQLRMLIREAYVTEAGTPGATLSAKKEPPSVLSMVKKSPQNPLAIKMAEIEKRVKIIEDALKKLSAV